MNEITIPQDRTEQPRLFCDIMREQVEKQFKYKSHFSKEINENNANIWTAMKGNLKKDKMQKVLNGVGAKLYVKTFQGEFIEVL
jgi:hypothetical protein